MKKNEVPISLFSFQDIITSLTGVMIIVILVIALQMIETIQKKNAMPPPDPEFTQMQERLRDARARLEAWREKMREESSQVEEDASLEEFRELTLTQLERLLAADEHQHQEQESRREELRKLREVLRQKREAARARQASLAESATAIQQKIVALESDIRQSEEARKDSEAKIAKLKQQSEALRDAIAQKTRQLAFAFAGRRTHTPILIECLGDRFHAAVYPPEKGKIHHFDSESYSANLDALVQWLKGFSFLTHYPVLLFRENALSRSTEIEKRLKEISPLMTIGRDPIASSIEVFPKE